jgi:hypothetical protein
VLAGHGSARARPGRGTGSTGLLLLWGASPGDQEPANSCNNEIEDKMVKLFEGYGRLLQGA